MERAELKKILENHLHWINEDVEGCEDMKANLGGADLRGADLGGADLGGANLGGADLRGANLGGADLDNVAYNYHTAFFAMQCPGEGSFVGWKKVNGLIVKLLIPGDARRSSATSRKCRCSHAEVLDILNIDGTKADVCEVVNYTYVPSTTYKVGDIVHADSWDEDRWNECSHGIHFFITREEAMRY